MGEVLRSVASYFGNCIAVSWDCAVVLRDCIAVSWDCTVVLRTPAVERRNSSHREKDEEPVRSTTLSCPQLNSVPCVAQRCPVRS